MEVLQKTKQRIDPEVAEAIQEDLMSYLKRHETTVGKLNYIKTNA